jgi:predicted PurR-regulated permease PerM
MTMASDQSQGPVSDPADAAGRRATARSYAQAKVPSKPAVVAIVGGVLLAMVLLATAGALSIFVVGLALAYVIDPAVTALAKRGAPRWLASLALILLMILILFAFTVILASSVVSQGSAFVASAPTALENVRTWLDEAPINPQIRDALVTYASGLGATLGSIDLFAVLPGVAASLFSVFDVTIAAFGLPFYVFIVVVDRPSLAAEVERRLPDPWRADIMAVSGIVARQFGNYIRSEVILMVLLGVMTWAGLMLLSVLVDPRIADYAVFLAVVAAFSELIPLIGPWIAAIPALVFGLTLGPVSLVAIAVLFVLLSFIEGNILVPAIESRSFALRPAVVAPVIAIGLALGGAFGAVLAVPTASAVRDVYSYVFRRAEGATPASALAEPETP